MDTVTYLTMPDWSAITARLTETTGEPFALSHVRPLGGGCINRAAVIDDGRRRFFVKRNDAPRLDMFIAEAEGLRELAAARAVRVPAPVCWGASEDTAFLVLEYLELSSAGRRSQERLGERLADLHRITRPQFGWHRDNTIGSTPQPNASSGRWAEFFRDRRLRFQLDLAARHGYRTIARAGERLLARVDALLGGHAARPALLHGDLWSGNVAATHAQEPVVFDPAVYFGDREADLAMTELFGGFSDAFYGTYRDAWPLDAGYEMRRTLYNLYHVLNHVNLFGHGYAAQAERMINELLAESG